MDPVNFDAFYLPSPDLVERELVEIDARIAELELTLVKLKRRRNFLAPISRLTPDVLLNIFEYVQYDDSDADFDVTHPIGRTLRAESPLPWIRVLTHVHSRWRSIALDTATLWSDIMFRCHSDLYAREMLKRSRAAPLSINFSPQVMEPDDSFFCDVLSTQIQRIRKLDIFSEEEWFHNHKEILGTSSILETLSLTTMPRQNPLFLPVQLLQCSSNTLCYLRLYSISFNTQDLGAPIHLPVLKKLTISNRAARCGALLEMLYLPPTCIAILECFDSEHTFEALSPFITRFFETRSSSGNFLAHLNLTGPSRHENNLSLAFKKDATCFEYELIIELVRVVGQVTLDIIRDMLPPISLTHLTSIESGEGDSYDHIIWVHFAQCCLNVESLSFKYLNDFSPFFKSLRIPRQQGDQSGVPVEQGATARAKPVRFSKLKDITLGGLKVELYSPEIIKVARNRSKAGIPLRDVTFESAWEIGWEFRQTLRELVEGSVLLDCCDDVSESEEDDEGEEEEDDDLNPGEVAVE